MRQQVPDRPPLVPAAGHHLRGGGRGAVEVTWETGSWQQRQRQQRRRLQQPDRCTVPVSRVASTHIALRRPPWPPPSCAALPQHPPQPSTHLPPACLAPPASPPPRCPPAPPPSAASDESPPPLRQAGQGRQELDARARVAAVCLPRCSTGSSARWRRSATRSRWILLPSHTPPVPGPNHCSRAPTRPRHEEQLAQGGAGQHLLDGRHRRQRLVVPAGQGGNQGGRCL